MSHWKVMICDDDETIHEMTRFILSDFKFLDKKVQLLHAYSVDEGIITVKEQPDIAVILQDMIMEEDESGVKMTRQIRNELDNKKVRIILRTGKSITQAPRELVEQYDISDYLDKTEFTSQKLHMALYTSIMDYHRMNQT